MMLKQAEDTEYLSPPIARWAENTFFLPSSDVSVQWGNLILNVEETKCYFGLHSVTLFHMCFALATEQLNSLIRSIHYNIAVPKIHTEISGDTQK